MAEAAAPKGGGFDPVRVCDYHPRRIPTQASGTNGDRPVHRSVGGTMYLTVVREGSCTIEGVAETARARLRHSCVCVSSPTVE